MWSWRVIKVKELTYPCSQASKSQSWDSNLFLSDSKSVPVTINCRYCNTQVYFAALSKPAANLENSAVATGLEKVSFHSIPKKGNAKECSSYCTTALISHASKVRGFVIIYYSPSEASTVCELKNSRCSSWIQKRQRNKRLYCQHPLDHGKSKRVPEKHLFLLY